MVRIEGFIDRFENDVAVILKLDHTFDLVPRQTLPLDAREGDFIVEINEKHQFAIDLKITELRRRDIRRLCDCDFA